MNVLALIPAGMDINSLTIAALGFVAFIAVVVVWAGLMKREPSLRRIRDVSGQGGASAGAERRRRGSNKASGGFMRQVVVALNLLRTERAQEISLRLASAGWRQHDALVKYLFAKLVLPFVFGLGTLLWLSTTPLFATSLAMRALAAMGVTVFGFMLPEIWIKNAVQKRQVKIQRQLPDAIDLMVTCAEAGLSLPATLQRVAEEFQVGAPEIADELSLTCVEMEFLPDRGQALVNLADRVGLPSVRSMVNTLQQSAKFGTPLSQALRVLAAEFRDERILKAEEKAARLPALMTVPMVLFILPSLFVVLIGPAVLRIFDQLIK